MKLMGVEVSFLEIKIKNGTLRVLVKLNPVLKQLACERRGDGETAEEGY